MARFRALREQIAAADTAQARFGPLGAAVEEAGRLLAQHVEFLVDIQWAADGGACPDCRSLEKAGRHLAGCDLARLAGLPPFSSPGPANPE